ncbi:MAG: acetyl-CoA carboxylase biotin carboxyl carrier protein subunit [Polymorphobacter sp.]
MAGYVLVDGTAHRAGLAGNAALGYRLFTGLGPEAPAAGGPVVSARDGDTLWVHLGGTTYRLEYRDTATYLAQAAGVGGDVLRAPMPGSVIAVGAAAGDAVRAGAMVMIIESMKLETVIAAPRDGVVAAVHFAVGDRFDRDAVLAELADGAV